MTKLISSSIFAASAFFAVLGFAAVANAAGPNPSACGVGKAAPAYQDEAMKAVKMTWTCDSQEGTGGFNWKQLGSSKPLQYQGCTIRWKGVGGTKSCKVVATDVKPTTVDGKPAVILVTNKGELVTKLGMFGTPTISKN